MTVRELINNWEQKTLQPRKQIKRRNGRIMRSLLEEEEEVLDTLDKMLEEEDYKDVVWKPWQQEVLDIITTTTTSNEKTIHWYWDSTGGTGKTFLCRYLETIGSYITAGESYRGFRNEKVVAVDIPRSYKHYRYNVITNFKTGRFFEKDRETPSPPPHVFVFANFPPILALYNDWRVIKIQ